MPAPFAAETWVQRTSVPNLPLNGVYSGAVQGPVHAVYDPESRVIQTFSAQAHHFNGFVNTAQISLNDGASWAPTFNADQDINLNKFAVTGWAIPNPSGEGRIHFQVRVNWQKASLVFDGSLFPGGVELWASAGDTSFFKLQDLHSWPAINQIGGNGGAALFLHQPAATPPILLEGSGPDGEDAYWFVTSYSFTAGGAGNRTAFETATLWRSIDGGITWEVARDMSGVTGIHQYAELALSHSGRLLLVGAGAGPIFFTDDADDLENAVWTQSQFNGVPGVRGRLVPMYGGTWLTHSQGTLTGPGLAWISCDDGENFNATGVSVIPQNRSGFLRKLGPTEGLIVAPGFNDPTTETSAEYTSDGGETWQSSEPWLVSSVGELPVMLGVRSDGTPIVVTRTGGCYVSSDKARGVAGTRTICPLANAGLAQARRLVLCGGVITPDCQE